MKKRNNFCYCYSYRKAVSFIFKWHNRAIFILLFCSIGLAPLYSFAQLAANKSKFVGNIIGNAFSIRESNFKKYWNQVTAENAGKWGSVEFSPGNYSWTQLDNIYNFAVNNGLPYKHHNLVWGNQQPGFMSTLDSTNQYREVENWIKAVGQRYPKIDFCDVVNEPLHAPPVYKNALGGDGATGWDWVIKTFELARQYLPSNTKLHLNEYSVINDGNANARFIQIINLLKDRGLIDGIGVQGHYFEVDGGTSVVTLQRNMDNLAATGLPIYITEFDINQQDDNTQLQRYQTVFPVLYEHPGVKGITLWGYFQFETWRDYTYLVTDRLAERPAMQWLRTYLASPLRPELISPNGTTGEQRNPLLVWHASESATSYNLQVTDNSRFSTVVVDTTVADTLLQLNPLAADTKFYWRVSATNEFGTSFYSNTASFTTGQTTAVDEIEEMPTTFALQQNYPNPFWSEATSRSAGNPSTRITYSIPRNSHVSLKVYNLLGKEVKSLFDGVRDAGKYVAVLDGSGLAPGVYFYQLKANNFQETRRLILLK
jgi:endo-1,4-beta-xylanase